MQPKRSKHRKPPKMGRPKGVKSAERNRRAGLTRVQKLREHILIELGIEKTDIARAIGTTVQTVSNCFLDVHRSEWEEKIVAYLAAKYTESEDRDAIDRLFPVGTFARDETFDVNPVTLDTMGWSKRSSVAPTTSSELCGKPTREDLRCDLSVDHAGPCDDGRD